MKALIISGAADLRPDDRDHTNSPTFTFKAEAQALGVEGCTDIAVTEMAAADGAGTAAVGQACRTLHLAGTGYWTNSPYPYLTGLKSGSRMVAESLGTSRHPRNFPSRYARVQGRMFGRPRAVREFAGCAALRPVVPEVRP